MAEREVRYCTTEDGVRIAYTVEGEGPVLLVTPFLVESFLLTHLSPGHESFMKRLRERLRVIEYDNRNVGASQRNAPGAADATVQDIEAVLGAAADGPLSVWGRGTGGPAAIVCAARQPDKVDRLILYGTAARIMDNFSEAALSGLANLMRADWAQASRTLADFSGRREFGERALENATLYERSTTGAEAATMTELVQFDAAPYLSQINCKTLVVHPMDDSGWSPEVAQRMTAAIPGASFVPVKGSFHHIAFGDPEPVLTTIFSFIGVSPGIRPESATESPDLRTVLFTDLVGHTAMMSRLGDEKGREVLREHERITREVLKEYGGTEVKTMGDGFMASFGSVTRAVECAVALQRAFAEREGEPLAIRVGLNAGEPIEEEGDLFGATVILASRIAGKAEGGEILVSDTVRGLCSGKGFLFSDRGEFLAKGFEEPVRVFAVEWEE